jgi:hypothetical protein
LDVRLHRRGRLDIPNAQRTFRRGCSGPGSGDQQVARRVRADTRFLRSAQLSTGGGAATPFVPNGHSRSRRATRLLPQAKRKPATPWLLSAAESG